MRILNVLIPTFKIHRIILPLAVFIAGITIFICGLIRSYHLPASLAKNIYERRFVQMQSDYQEWWVGFLLMGTAVWAILAVMLDRAWMFKLALLMVAFSFVMSLFGFFWDAGEFSNISRNKRLVNFLEQDGHVCKTNLNNFTYAGVRYLFHDCQCKSEVGEINFSNYIPFSCELLNGLYYTHAVQAFALSCAVAFTMLTIFSFVLILKRISQITTALHLDEKPLSEDFANISGD